MSGKANENSPLRQALATARLRERDVAEALGVDPKTVQRWLSGRRPQLQHRWAVADLLGTPEHDLWPELGGPTIDRSIVASYPHRSSVPRETWHELFSAAERQIDVLVYAGLFLAEDVELMALLAIKAREGVAVRLLLGDADCAAVRQRGQDEGIDDAMAAKVRNALVLHRTLLIPHGAELRLHDTVLYNSVYRGDEEMLVNPHAYGMGAPQAPVLHLRSSHDGTGLFSLHANAFERIWTLGEAGQE